MIRLNKLCKLIFSCAVFFILILQSYLLVEELHQLKSVMPTLHTKPLSSTKNILNMNKTVFFYKTYEWMLNNRVYQYSAQLLIRNNTIVQIDSIITTRGDFNDDAVKQAFRCVIKSFKNDYEKQFRINVAYHFVGFIKRVICNTDLHLSDINDVGVAIIDLFDYKSGGVILSENDLDKMDLKLPKNMMNFQKPRLIFLQEAKLQQIAHCVHYSYNLAVDDMDKIMKWIEIQKNFGIKKIIMYDTSIHDLLRKAVYEVYDKSFIDVRPYYIQFEAICDFNRLNVFKIFDIVKYQTMKDQCEDAFYNVFDNPTYSSKNRWKHQKITSNDCYSSLQHIYQFVSYFDFDEIIYPRMFRIDNSLSLDKKSSCDAADLCEQASKYKRKIDLHQFITQIIKTKSHHSMNKISSLYFTNGVYLEPNLHVKQIMSSLYDLITYNQSYFNLPSNKIDNSSVAKIHLKLTHHYGHYFLVYPHDYEYIKLLYESYVKIECIHESVVRQVDSNLNPTFKRFLFLATERDHHMGKSIHNTDNVLAVFTHYSTNVKPNTNIIEVNRNDAILSHFRIDLFFLARQLKSNITNLKIDVEYYLHLISNYSNICKI